MDTCDSTSLVELHIAALYTSDADGSLRAVNEPWDKTAPACAIFVGRPVGGPELVRFRYDIPPQVREKALALPAGSGASAYLGLLGGTKCYGTVCCVVPARSAVSADCAAIDSANVQALTRAGFEWLRDEIAHVQPCVGVIADGQIVSVCRSVRITGRAHEAGIETLAAYRGRGLAGQVLAGWAYAVRERGAVALYSTGADNSASRRVAEKAGLIQYGTGLTVL